MKQYDVWKYLISIKHVDIVKISEGILNLWNVRESLRDVERFGADLTIAALNQKVDGINLKGNFTDANRESRELEIISVKISKSFWDRCKCYFRGIPASFSAVCSDIRVDGITVIGSDGGFIPRDGFGE